MKCSFPPPLMDDQLSSALDGVADRAVDDHLAGCAYCAARLAQAQQAEQMLHAGLHRLDCPTPQQLGDYQLKLVGRADARAIARHLKECARCTGELEDLQVYLAADQAVVSPARQPARPALQSLGKLFAHILPRTPALALRGAGPEPIIAEAKGATIILNMDPAPNERVTIQGQVVADDSATWANSLVELRQAGTLEATATVNDLGGFSLGPIPAAISELRITPQLGHMLVLQDIPFAT
jgi:hypothetical protein